MGHPEIFDFHIGFFRVLIAEALTWVSDVDTSKSTFRVFCYVGAV